MTTIENLPEIVSREEWLAARKELLQKEKEVTHARARANADRRRLPMVRIDKPYIFEGPNGTVSLLDLFEGRQQLVMHHFMWMFDTDADGKEQPRDHACSSCSSAADGIPQHLRQLHARNTTLVAVTRAPYDKIAAFRERMGWTFPWYSSWENDFNYDFHATVDEEERQAISVFLRDGERVFHTWSTFARGEEPFMLVFDLLDLTPYGRQESWEDSPAGWPQSWIVDGSNTRIDGRPIPQWSRLEAGRSDDLGSDRPEVRG